MILIIEKSQELTDLIVSNQKKGKTIGFVPTMGALHEGHLTLVNICQSQNDLSIISIFVNPTQFNNKKDLEKYPRTLSTDLEKLAGSGVDIVFAPAEQEIYPPGNEEKADFNLGGLDRYMEGAFRPGHFKGVAQVVKRLLDITVPDKIYMGQKDFQQFTIIQYIIKTLHIKTELVICPIIRERNGLAMSSRNTRLSVETREKAGIIYKTLQAIKKRKNADSVEHLISYGMKRLNVPPFEPEYLTIVDGNKLTPVLDINDTNFAVACVAVWAEGVRLIDNIILTR